MIGLSRLNLKKYFPIPGQSISCAQTSHDLFARGRILETITKYRWPMTRRIDVGSLLWHVLAYVGLHVNIGGLTMLGGLGYSLIYL